MRKYVYILLFILGAINISLFQNCSETRFENIPALNSLGDLEPLGEVEPVGDIPESVICDPFEKEPNVDCTDSKGGLTGNVYYLSKNLLNKTGINSLDQAELDDYFNYGKQVKSPIFMSQINISPRSWMDGFISNNGAVIEDDAGKALVEWFSIRLIGGITLNTNTASESYEFAILADDGMRVMIDDKIIIEDDGIHSPRWACTKNAITFNPSAKKKIEVHYFQGPRTEISMQLFYRDASQSNGKCNSGGGWKTIPSSAYAGALGPVK